MTPGPTPSAVAPTSLCRAPRHRSGKSVGSQRNHRRAPGSGRIRLQAPGAGLQAPGRPRPHQDYHCSDASPDRARAFRARCHRDLSALAQTPGSSPRQLFEQACQTCHGNAQVPACRGPGRAPADDARADLRSADDGRHASARAKPERPGQARDRRIPGRSEAGRERVGRRWSGCRIAASRRRARALHRRAIGTGGARTSRTRDTSPRQPRA